MLNETNEGTKVDAVAATDETKPPPPETHSVPPEMPAVTFMGEELLAAFDATFRAISEDETRKALNALLVEITREKEILRLRFVATNGHWIAVYEFADADLGGAEECATLIPRESVDLIRRLLKTNKDGVVDLDLANHVVHVREGDAVDWKPVRGELFPPWRTVFEMVDKAPDGTAPAIGVTGKYLAAVAASFKAAGSETVAMRPGPTPLDGILVTAANAPTLRVVLMPARDPAVETEDDSHGSSSAEAA